MTLDIESEPSLVVYDYENCIQNPPQLIDKHKDVYYFLH